MAGFPKPNPADGWWRVRPEDDRSTDARIVPWRDGTQSENDNSVEKQIHLSLSYAKAERRPGLEKTKNRIFVTRGLRARNAHGNVIGPTP